MTTSNRLYIIESESASVVSLLRKVRSKCDTIDGSDEDAEELDELLSSFDEATAEHAGTGVLDQLRPLLATIRSPRTDAATTAQALTAVHTVLVENIIPHEEAAQCAWQIGEATTRARFTSRERESHGDEVVLANIVRVLEALLCGKIGSHLSNQCVCEVVQATFRLCFEPKLSSVLRDNARSALTNIIRTLFSRLHEFNEDTNHPYIRKLKARSGRRRSRQPSPVAQLNQHPTPSEQNPPETVPAVDNATDVQQSEATPESEKQLPRHQESHASVRIDIGDETDMPVMHDAHLPEQYQVPHADEGVQTESSTEAQADVSSLAAPSEPQRGTREYKNIVAIRTSEESHTPPTDPEHRDSPSGMTSSEFAPTTTTQSQEPAIHEPICHDNIARDDAPTPTSTEETAKEREINRSPYSLPCVREVFRFSITLTSPLDNSNTESMQELGMYLVAVALETAAEHLPRYTVMMPLVQNQLCRAILAQLSNTDGSEVLLAATLRLMHVLVRDLRTHLKLQIEMFIQRLLRIIQDANGEDKALLALSAIERMWRIPGIVRQLYVNYDCDVNSNDILEDTVKVLSANAFPVTRLSHVHVLCMNALTTCLRSIYDNIVKQQNDETLVNIDDANIPTRQYLAQMKQQKGVVVSACDVFSTVKPEKGLAQLQENGLLATPAPPADVAAFLRNNMRLDKKKIADYICNRKHTDVLAAFVQSFDFADVRIDEALRMFLESFRLPGEAPQISMVMTHFAEHWHHVNNEPFANADAAFTLAYGIIMLNTDQHNPQVRRNQPPMTVACFKRNLSGCNGGKDFDEQLLEKIYNAIKNEEIVMPAEQTGVIRDNYEWKLLLKRQQNVTYYAHVKGAALLDHDVFARVWGPTIAALAFNFDKTRQPVVLARAVSGFTQCATVAASYGMSHVLDNLVITLCKFTHLTNAASESGAAEHRGCDSHGVCLSSKNLTFTVDTSRHAAGSAAPALLEPWALKASAFGSDQKAQLAARTLSGLIHAHAHTIQDGWKNVLDILLTLYHARLLDERFTKVEDYHKATVSIEPPAPTRSTHHESSGLLSSLVFYLGGNASDQRTPRQPDDQELGLIKTARDCVAECDMWCIVSDSKYMPLLSLQHLVYAVMYQSSILSTHQQAATEWRIYSRIFYLELLFAIALENRDRLLHFWLPIQEHVCSLILLEEDAVFLHERSIVGVLRVASRHMYSADAIHALLLAVYTAAGCLRPDAPANVWRSLAYGVHELTHANAANIHAPAHWRILTRLMAAAGARHPLPSSIRQHCLVNLRQGSATPQPTVSEEPTSQQRAQSMDDIYEQSAQGDQATASSVAEQQPLTRAYTSEPQLLAAIDDEWIHVSTPAAATTPDEVPGSAKPFEFHIDASALLLTNWRRQSVDARAFVRCVDTLSFVMRDTAHVTTNNMRACVDCLRAFVHAVVQYNEVEAAPSPSDTKHDRRSRHRARAVPSTHESQSQEEPAVESPDDAARDALEQAPHRLLELAYVLHTNAARIVDEYTQSESVAEPHTDILLPSDNPLALADLWPQCHRPLLQCIAALCTDARRHVRHSALDTLARAFLVPSLSRLSAAEWEDCMASVLLPLLSRLSTGEQAARDPLGVEESRVRAIALTCKQLLNHIQSLATSQRFASLWLCLLQFMKHFMSTSGGGSELLREAVPESLKNMLLVAHSIRLFELVPDLYTITKECVDSFLPDLVDELVPFMEGATNPAASETKQVQPSTSVVQQSQAPVAAPVAEVPQQVTPAVPQQQQVLPLVLSSPQAHWVPPVQSAQICPPLPTAPVATQVEAPAHLQAQYVQAPLTAHPQQITLLPPQPPQ